MSADIVFDDVTSVDEILTEIRRTIRTESRPVYCFVGAGLSARAGLPTWRQLLDRILVQLESSAYSEKERTLADFKSALANADFPRAGEIYQKSSIRYEEKQRLFDSELLTGKRPTSVHRELIRFGFDGILTTNYDHLFEDAYAQIRGVSTLPFLPGDLENNDVSFGSTFFIAKLHGDVARWNSIVIGEEDFRRAKWTAKAKELVSQKIVMVFGVSGKDRLINDFLFDLHASSIVYLFMTESRLREYKEAVLAFHDRIPSYIQTIPIPHSSLEKLIHQLNPDIDYPNVIDCPWGEMPPILSTDVWAERNYEEIRNFLFSNMKLAHVSAPSGAGLSSLLARSLIDRAQSKDAIKQTTVLRLEAKEWMCWDKYVLHILGSMNDVFDAYSKRRHEATEAWSNTTDAIAVAHSLRVRPGPVILCIEHSDRLPANSWDYLKTLIAHSNDDFKLLVATSIGVPSPLTPDADIHIDPPDGQRLLALCDYYPISVNHMEPVIAANQHTDMNTAVLAASLFSKQVITRQELEACVRSSDLSRLCRELVKEVANDETLLRALKASVLFRSPRTITGISACLGESVTDATSRECMTNLCHLGVLIERRLSQGVPSFAMTTNIRGALISVLDWEPLEKEETSSRIGDYYRAKAFKDLQDRQRSRKAYYEAIPVISIALYHYKIARNREKYIDTVARVYNDLVQMYHFNIVRIWLEDAKELRNSSDDTQANSDCVESLIMARLALVASVPKEFRDQLEIAKTAAVKLQAQGDDVSEYRMRIQWYESVLATVQRKYGKALDGFNRCSSLATDGEDIGYRFKARLRVAQTLMSLARLKEAENELNTIETDLNALAEDQSGLAKHNRAVLARHRSTLCIVRLLLFGHRPIKAEATKVDLLNRAIVESEKCLLISQELKFVPQRMERPDETGIGIGNLKKAQAYFAARHFEESIESARSSAAVLAAYPNNRWWRMVCHDTAARSLARLRRIEEAEQELRMAEDIWKDSAQEDKLRWCEHQATRGLIELERGDLFTATAHLLRSIECECDSVCTIALHMNYLAEVHARAADFKSMAIVAGKLKKLAIDW